jgi:PAS domain-containing protein
LDRRLGGPRAGLDSENRVLRRIFGRKRKEVAGGWRRLHNEEFHNLYTCEGNRLLERPRPRWEDNIRIYLGEVGWQGVDGFIWVSIGTSCGVL